MGNKVLIIDDEKSICELVELALSGKGYEVKTAFRGEKGVDLVKEFSPDLILLDMLMPDIDGTEAARLIKKMEKGKDIPIILMSGRGTLESELDKTLFTAMLNKPFSIADLVRAVDKHTKNKTANKV
ncbi:response regulator [Methanocella sp. CWC-04]|uniref:Response regulator n=1 Tax=Methanooceanicella nereidis TaxID=2052831 RepID=A0AAP2W6W6_9EURY|nr:response regulator [Methanocella sp. CWC-04]MCD1295737.1 response regulator [Methanocella sp. CWC-04]